MGLASLVRLEHTLEALWLDNEIVLNAVQPLDREGRFLRRRRFRVQEELFGGPSIAGAEDSANWNVALEQGVNITHRPLPTVQIPIRERREFGRGLGRKRFQSTAREP